MSAEDLNIHLSVRNSGIRSSCQRTVISLRLSCPTIILKYAIKVEVKLRWSSEQTDFGLLAAASWLPS